MKYIKFSLLLMFVVANSFTSIGQVVYSCENDNAGNRLLGMLFSGLNFTPYESKIIGVGPRSVAIDDVNRKIYWTNLMEGTINRSNPDGTDSEVIISEGYQPFDVVVSQSFNKLFWTDLNGYLVQSNFDGSDIVVLLENEISSPTALSIHDGLGILFWLEDNSIKSLNLNTDEVNLVLPNDGSILNDIAVYEFDDKLYWTNQSSGRIIRANLDGSIRNSIITAIEGKKPFSLAIFKLPETTYGFLYWTEFKSEYSTLWGGSTNGGSRSRMADISGGKHWGVAVATDDFSVSVENLDREYNFDIYPNPATNLLNIDVEGLILNDDHTVEVTDINGKLLISNPLRNYSEQLNLSAINSGNYFIVLKEGSKILMSKKFLKL